MSRDDVSTSHTGVTIYNVLLEYASGGALIDRIDDGLPEDTVREYTHSILLGIKQIHDHGIIHCYLKPENILLVQNAASLPGSFIPKICDFGLSKRATDCVTKLRGTTPCFSPEIVDYGIQGAASDIWALGVIVIIMLTGCSPWKTKSSETDDDDDDICLQISSESPSIPDCISKEGKDFLQKCFTRSPVERWTADALLKHPFLVGTVEDVNIQLPLGILPPSDSFSYHVERPVTDIQFKHSVVRKVVKEGNTCNPEPFDAARLQLSLSLGGNSLPPSSVASSTGSVPGKVETGTLVPKSVLS